MHLKLKNMLEMKKEKQMQIHFYLGYMIDMDIIQKQKNF